MLGLLLLDKQLKFQRLEHLNTYQERRLLSSNEESAFIFSDIEDHVIPLKLSKDRNIRCCWQILVDHSQLAFQVLHFILKSEDFHRYFCKVGYQI